MDTLHKGDNDDDDDDDDDDDNNNNNNKISLRKEWKPQNSQTLEPIKWGEVVVPNSIP